MSTEIHSQIANDIWSICNLLRGPYKRNEYRKVIRPLTVLRRFDCLLASTKAQALTTFNEFKSKPESIIRSKMQVAIRRSKDGQAEPDAELRDTENMPLKESIKAYFERKVLPHVPDAWIDHTKTKIGYEIPLNRHFYRYEPPHELSVIDG